jgi:tape measure domain-containing protein
VDINLGRLAAYVRLDFSKLKGDQDKARKSLKDFSTKLTKEIGQSFSDLGQRMSVGITAPLLALGKGAVDAATKMDSLTRGLTAVSGSSMEAERQLKRLREVAKLPGLSFEQAIEGSTRLQAAGFSAQMAERSLKAFGNALATVGKGSAELEGVNLALSQIQSKGKVTAEEINQIAERVPQIRQVMLRVFGTADTEVLQRAKITSQQFVQAIVGELEKLPKVTGGVSNSFENFKDSMQQALAELGKAILPDLMRAMKEVEDAVKRFSGWWKELPEDTRTNIVRFGEFVLAIGPVIFVVGNLVKAFEALKIATLFLRTPGGLIGAGVVLGVAGLTKVISDLNDATKNSTKNAVARDAAEKQSNAKKYFQNQINSARARMLGQTDPAIIAANQRMIARAEAELRKVSPPEMFGPAAPKKQPLDPLALMLRNQIAAGQQEAAARKAEAARNKAEAEARRRQAARDRREGLIDRVMQNADRFSIQGLNAQLAEWAAQATPGILFRKAVAESDLRDFMKDLRGDTGREDSLQGIFERSAEVAARERAAAMKAQRKMAGQGTAFMGGASDALSSALGSLSPMAQKAAEQAAAQRIALEEKMVRAQVQFGNTSLSDYKAYLERRLEAIRGNLDEEIRLKTEIQQVEFQLAEDTERRRFRGWQNLARGLENVFASAFYDVLAQGKDFFQAFVDAFKQMIAQMLAAALASGIMRALFGGPGGFLGGFLSVFGFDSAGNDAKAHRWGFDFARHFTSGSRDFQRQRTGNTRMAASGTGPVSVNVNFGPVTVNNGMDIQTIGEQIGMATRNALRRNV